MNKVILVSHLQQILLEEELAGVLNGVDIIATGGSDTLLAEAQNTLGAGDVVEGTDKLQVNNADNDLPTHVDTNQTHNDRRRDHVVRQSLE